MTIEKIRNLLQDEMKCVDAVILENLQSSVPLIPIIANYLIKNGGKRLRPLLTLLIAKTFNPDILTHHIHLAASIEFIHSATLLHDDVVDNSKLRRGAQTANAIWDNTSSVLVGDFLLSRAFEMLVDTQNMPLMAWMARTTNQIAAGEMMQLQFQRNAATTEADYLAIIQAKTAVLFSVAARGSALLIPRSETNTQQSLADYGMYLGIAFQLIDDVLDYCATVDDLGKDIGDDLAEGKPTLPLIYALTKANKNQAKLITEAIEKGGMRDNLADILKIIEATGAIEYTHQLAITYRDKAKTALQNTPLSIYRDALIELADFTVTRRY